MCKERGEWYGESTKAEAPRESQRVSCTTRSQVGLLSEKRKCWLLVDQNSALGAKNKATSFYSCHRTLLGIPQFGKGGKAGLVANWALDLSPKCFILWTSDECTCLALDDPIWSLAQPELIPDRRAWSQPWFRSKQVTYKQTNENSHGFFAWLSGTSMQICSFPCMWLQRER